MPGPADCAGRAAHRSARRGFLLFCVPADVSMTNARSDRVSADISGQLILLGTGTSGGVPVIGCGCSVCTSSDPRNRRTRCGLALGLPGGTLLIDTPPDLRTQLLREGIGQAQAVAFTHGHADHLHGLDD